MPSADKVPTKLVRKRLNEATLMAHLEALAREAAAIELRVKDERAGHSSEAGVALPEAGRRLIAGELVALQIRFHQDGEWWCDTLLRARDGFRLVRMRQG